MRLLFAVLCLSLVAACGGGNGSVGDSAKSPTRSGQSVNGFIVIEERQGKRVFDAWFSSIPASVEHGELLWQSGSQHCQLLDTQWLTQVSSESDEPDSLRAGTQWRQTLFAGDSIDFSSRDGTVVSLRAQRHGHAVLYATDERWLATALPDDVRLSIPGSDVFPGFDSLALAPVTPLVQELSEGGELNALIAPIVWQVSDDADDSVEILLTGTPSLDPGSGVRRVRCSLADSGEFSVPAEVHAALSVGSRFRMTLVRKRESRFQSEDATLTVVQLSHP